MLHNHRGGSDLDDDSGHLGLAQDWDRHARASEIREADTFGQRSLDQRGELGAPDRLVMVAGVVRGGTPPAAGVQAKTKVDVYLVTVGLLSLYGVVWVVQLTYMGACT